MGAGVIDIGTARVKLTVATSTSSSGSVEVSQIKWDVGGSSNEELISRLMLALQSAKDAAQRQVVTIHKVVATEAFRSNQALRSALPQIAEVIGDIEVLTPSVEAKLFWEGISSIVLEDNLGVAADIGGGSVQVVWGERDDKFFSYPIGTFSLERSFQTERSHMSKGEILAAKRFVHETFRPHAGRVPLGLPLALGSNVMADFFSSSLSWQGKPVGKPGAVLVQPNEITALLEAVAGRDYSALAAVFPANPGFMFGADKALIVIAELCELLQTSVIIPTNESISSALARRFLTHQS